MQSREEQNKAKDKRGPRAVPGRCCKAGMPLRGCARCKIPAEPALLRPGDVESTCTEHSAELSRWGTQAKGERAPQCFLVSLCKALTLNLPAEGNAEHRHHRVPFSCPCPPLHPRKALLESCSLQAALLPHTEQTWQLHQLLESLPPVQ